METKLIDIKRISHHKKSESYIVFFVMDIENIRYQFTGNLMEFSATTEVMSLAKVGDTLKISYSSANKGPLGLFTENKIYEAEFRKYVD